MDSITNSSGRSGAAAGAARAKKRPRFFLFWAFDFYVVWLAASLLPPPPSLDDFWFFVLAQIVCGALWYWLHAMRLRDAGRSVASARGVAAIYLLAVGLLLLLVTFMEEFGRYFIGHSVDMIGRLVTFSRGFDDALGYLAWLACLALLVPPVFSIWAALQPKRTA